MLRKGIHLQNRRLRDGRAYCLPCLKSRSAEEAMVLHCMTREQNWDRKVEVIETNSPSCEGVLPVRAAPAGRGALTRTY